MTKSLSHLLYLAEEKKTRRSLQKDLAAQAAIDKEKRMMKNEKDAKMKRFKHEYEKMKTQFNSPVARDVRSNARVDIAMKKSFDDEAEQKRFADREREEKAAREARIRSKSPAEDRIMALAKRREQLQFSNKPNKPGLFQRIKKFFHKESLGEGTVVQMSNYSRKAPKKIALTHSVIPYKKRETHAEKTARYLDTLSKYPSKNEKIDEGVMRSVDKYLGSPYQKWNLKSKLKSKIDSNTENAFRNFTDIANARQSIHSKNRVKDAIAVDHAIMKHKMKVNKGLLRSVDKDINRLNQVIGTKKRPQFGRLVQNEEYTNEGSIDEGIGKALAYGAAATAAGAITGHLNGLGAIPGAIVGAVGYGVLDAKKDLFDRQKRTSTQQTRRPMKNIYPLKSMTDTNEEIIHEKKNSHPEYDLEKRIWRIRKNNGKLTGRYSRQEDAMNAIENHYYYESIESKDSIND